MRHREDDTIMIKRSREPLEGFKRFAELADAITKWLEETSRRQSISVVQIVRTPTTPTSYVPLRYRPRRNSFSTTVEEDALNFHGEYRSTRHVVNMLLLESFIFSV
jgi:hypothetical protein